MSPALNKASALIMAAASLGGCAALREIENGPSLHSVQSPQYLTGHEPVVLPMPDVEIHQYPAGSLWRSGAREFFADQRAARTGDILTVQIEIDDSADVSNSTDRSRQSATNVGIPNILGFESKFASILPGAVDPSNLLTTQGSSSSNGTGTIARQERVQLTVAAIVTQVLPNGNLVVAGRQQVRVNQEVRDLTVTGVIRPEDITSQNTVRHTQMAEARISYGGKGNLSAIQAPRWGQKGADAISPF